MLYIHIIYIHILYTCYIYMYSYTVMYDIYIFQYGYILEWKRNSDGKKNDWNDTHYAFFLGKCDGRIFVPRNSIHGPNWPWYTDFLVVLIWLNPGKWYFLSLLPVQMFVSEVFKVVRLNSKVSPCLYADSLKASVQRLQEEVSIFSYK